MIQLLSVPMISMGFVSFFFFIFYLYLSLKTKSMDKQHVSYLIFSILSLVNTIYVISFAVLMNSANDLQILDISNRITIFSSMFVILLSLHFNKFFFDISGKKDLLFFYSLNFIFSIICFSGNPIFLAKKIFPTSHYYTGLEFGVLFQVWGIYIIMMMFYALIVLIRGYFFYFRTNREKSRGLLFLLIASIIWNTVGMLDALTCMQIIDLPPVTWVGSMVMILCIEVMLVTKIEYLHSQIRALYEKVIHDHSIDVFSRNYFEMELDKILKSVIDPELSYYLIFIDIDDFKTINDTYGHVCGDYVLKHIVEVMHKNLRKPDIVARYGGDEFIALMASKEGVEITTKIIDRLREKIAEEKFEFSSTAFHVTCSFGIVLIDRNSYKKTKTRDEIIAMADSALYHSKRLGKNKVYVLNIGSSVL